MQDDIRAIRADGEDLKLYLAKQAAMSLHIQKDTGQIRNLHDEFTSGANAKREAERVKRKIKIMEWLSNHDYSEEQHQNISQYVEGTGTRGLLSDPRYLKWEAGGTDLLLCVGIPGAGKTVTSAVAIRHLQEKSRLSGFKVAVGFLYFRYDRRHIQSSTDQLLRSLTRQLVDQASTIPDSINGAFRSELPQDWSWTDLFLDAVKCFEHIYFIVDALDESPGKEIIGDLFSRIRPDGAPDMPKPTRTRLQLLATSRYNLEVYHATFRKYSSVQVEIKASDLDIEHYVTSRLSALPSCVGSNTELREQVVRAVVVSTNGVFMHAKLNLDSLNNKRSVKAVKTALRNFTSGSACSLDTPYDDAMGRITAQSEDDYKLAQKVLTWVVHAMRPLTEVELQTVLAFEMGEPTFDSDNIIPIPDLLSLCAGLVSLDEQARTVRLAHKTTQEYFLRNRQKLLCNPHQVLANICAWFIGLEEFRSGGPINYQRNYSRLTAHKQHYKFLAYAVVHYEDHVSATPPSNEDADAEFDLRFLRDQSMMDFFMQHQMRAYGGGRRKMLYERKTGIQYASGKGTCKQVSALLEDGYGSNDTSFGTTPLVEACALLNEPTVKLLIDAGANVHLRGSGRHGVPPLMAALGLYRPKMYDTGFLEHSEVSRDYLNKVKRVFGPDRTHARASILAHLFAAGVDPNYTGKFDCQRDETALMFAARSGLQGVIATFCRAGADLDRQDSETGKTALHLSVERGHDAVVKELLKCGCNPDIADNSNLTPALCAAEKSHWAILYLLLDTEKVDVNRKTAAGATFLTTVCDQPWSDSIERITRRLLGSTPNCLDMKGIRNRTPLMCAAAAERPTMVRVLIDAGANVDLTDEDDNTVLHIVSGLDSGFTEANVIHILRSLCEGKMNVNIRRRDGVTALMIAAAAGDRGFLRALLLLELGADVLLKDNKGYTALTYAAGAGHKGLVTKMLHANSDDKDDLAAIAAASRGHMHILLLLISAGFNLETTTKDGTTAVMSAIKNGHFEVVKVLVESGVQVNARRRDGTSPLILAATRRSRKMTRLLLDAGALVNLSTTQRETALICALKYWVPRTNCLEEAHECLRMLVEAGASVDVLTEDGATPLSLASKNADVDPLTLELLLKAGADPNRSDGHGVTALTYVTMTCSARKLRLLISYGANPNVVSNDGKYALIMAVKNFGGLGVAKELLRAGVDPNQEDNNGQSALDHFISGPHYCSPDSIHEVAEALVSAAAKTDSFPKDDTLVLRAARFSSMSNNVSLKLLLAAGANPHGIDHEGRNAIMLAAMLSGDHGQEAVQILLDSGVDPNGCDHHGNNALMLAANSTYNPRTLKTLLGAGVDAHVRDGSGVSTLMVIASNPSESGDRIRALIEAGVSIDAVDEGGNTALIYAAEDGYSVQGLLDAGADPNHANNQGETALMKSFSRAINLAQKVRALLDAGANINSFDGRGWNALNWAISEMGSHVANCNTVVKMLLDAGVEVDHKDGAGDTALGCSERTGNVQVTDMIRERLDQINKKRPRQDNKGVT